MTDAAFHAKWSASKNSKIRGVKNQITNELEIGSAQDIGLASDFEGNFPNEMNGTLRTRKLYSQ